MKLQAARLSSNSARAAAPLDGKAKQMVWTGMLQTARGPLQCLVAELGKDGARLSPAAPVAAGQVASLVIRGMSTFRGEIVRRAGGDWGIRFWAETGVAAAE